jgi:pyruvate dehydrogenase E1 component beta subunit
VTAHAIAPGERAGAATSEVMTYREALRLALREEMARDDRVFLMGEEVGVFEGSYKVSAGLLAEFGQDRVRDTPISEEGFVGAGVGAAMLGERPVIEIMTINFLLVAIDQVVNHAAKIGAMFGGEVRCPLVIRTPNGAGNQLTAQHSQSLEGWFAHVPASRSWRLRRRPTRRACSRRRSATTIPCWSSRTSRSTRRRARCRSIPSS